MTQGRSTRPENLLATPEELAARGIELFEVGRGGDVTYHAPGQLVGYPIVDLAARGAQDVHAFLRDLEEALIEALAELGVDGERIAGKTGVFVARDGSEPPGAFDRKIASIGIGLRRWVTWHGFALNVSLDLKGFDVIVPCGLEGVAMTSVAEEWRRQGRAVPPDLDERARQAVERSFVALAKRWDEIGSSTSK